MKTALGALHTPPALATLASRWRALLRQFNQRTARERLLLIAAAAALLLVLADRLWLGPALLAFKTARSEQATALQLQQGLQADIHQLQTQGQQQARQAQADLALWRARVQDGEARLRSHEDSLVGPNRMLGLLEQLLAQQAGLRVLGLRSLGRSDLLAPGSVAALSANTTSVAPAGAGFAGAADAAGTTNTGNGLYRHGVELVLEGGYAELLAYLQAVEALPQRMLWGSVSLKVAQHPRSVLTLRVFTLSRDRAWLEI